MTLEAKIAHLNSVGWFIGSLCQLSPTEWYACVVDDEGYARTATGDTPIDAIAIACERPPMGRVYSQVTGILQTDSGDKIDLAALGLIPHRPEIKRRPL